MKIQRLQSWEQLNGEATEQLVGKIIKHALRDYARDIPAAVSKKTNDFIRRNKGADLTSKQKTFLKKYEEQLQNEKLQALAFFRKSDLFKATNLDFDYLVAHAKDLVDEEEYE